MHTTMAYDFDKHRMVHVNKLHNISVERKERKSFIKLINTERKGIELVFQHTVEENVTKD
jgi:hypothetical protein